MAFQAQRGLHVSGVCDEQTWLALVEAGWKLGDRLLKLTAPQLRGDDVAELQDSLNHLGFDCGRPDGILGPATARALDDFQRNSGMTVDGICGPQTVAALQVLGRQSGTGPGVASVRESEASSQPSALSTLRIVVGQFGGLSSVARPVARTLRHRGATVVSTDEYEAAAQAAAANRFGATVYIGFEALASTTSSPRNWGAVSLSSRSPSCQPASTSASHVCSSHAPLTCSPRWAWNAMSASRVDAQNEPASAPPAWKPAAPRRRWRSRIASPR